MLLHKGLLAISDAVLHVALHLRSRYADEQPVPVFLRVTPRPFTSVWRSSITEDGKNRYATLWWEPHASVKISKLSAE